MATYYCYKCGKNVAAFKKRISDSSGPFIAGHIAGDSDLPLIGTRLSSSYLINACANCGSEVAQTLTAEEQEQADEEQRRKVGLAWIWLIIAAIFTFFIVWIQL